MTHSAAQPCPILRLPVPPPPWRGASRSPRPSSSTAHRRSSAMTASCFSVLSRKTSCWNGLIKSSKSGELDETLAISGPGTDGLRDLAWRGSDGARGRPLRSSENKICKICPLERETPGSVQSVQGHRCWIELPGPCTGDGIAGSRNARHFPQAAHIRYRSRGKHQVSWNKFAGRL